MFATIGIMSGGAVYNAKWHDTDELSMEDAIKDECYGIVENNEKAVVTVELFEYKVEVNYNRNVPDSPARETDLKFVDSLTYIYDDKAQTLELIASHNVHKSLKKQKYETK